MQETIGDQILDYSYTSDGQILSVRYTEDVNSNEIPVYYYYALNSRGDVVGLYDHEGKLYAKYTYDVWGNPVSVTDASGEEITNPTDFANIQSIRYRSYYYDSDTGFYYLQSRYYDPITHRFLNADSQVSTDTGVLGYNMFAYCENNPVNWCDPSGLARNSTDDNNHNGIPDYLDERWIELTNRYRSIMSGVECCDVTNEVNTALKQAIIRDSNIIRYPFVIKALVFKSKVEDGAPWDIKRPNRWEETIGTDYPGKLQTVVIYEGHYYTPEILGNYTYGVLGKAYGFSLDILFAGSMYAAHFPKVGTYQYDNEMSDRLFIANGYYNEH